MRRLLALGALAALSSLGPSPAGAQKVVSAEVVEPAKPRVVSGVIDLEGRGSSAAGVKRVELFVDDFAAARVQPQELRQEAYVAHEWDTYHLSGSDAVAPNGSYTITVVAEAGDGSTDSDSVRVVVDNPPVAPTGLAVAARAGRVLLEWQPNPEPDITGYVVQRDTGDSFEALGRARYPRFERPLAPGTHRLRVVALRAGGTDRGPRSSPPSRPVVVEVAAAPSESGSGSGGRGGSGGSRGGTGAGSGSSGLPSAPRLPKGERGLPEAPSIEGPEDEAIEWGTYKKRLPYDLSEREDAGPLGTVADWASDVVPPDGLRWVAAGALLLVTAALFRLLAVRVVAGGEEDSAEAA